MSSSSGMMIDANLNPRIGESVEVIVEDHPPIEGIVRWIKQGRVGLDVGDGNIELG